MDNNNVNDGRLGLSCRVTSATCSSLSKAILYLSMKNSYLKMRKNLTILGLFNSYILIVRFYNFEIVSKLVAIHRPVYAL